MSAPITNPDANGGCLNRLVRQPRHKWFSAPDRRCEDGWYGPHETIEAAIIECASNYGTEHPIFVAQGYKLTKAEREEWGAEFDWQCESQNAIEVRLPNAEVSDGGDRSLMLAEEILSDLATGYWVAVLDDSDAPMKERMGQRILNYWRKRESPLPLV